VREIPGAPGKVFLNYHLNWIRALRTNLELIIRNNSTLALYVSTSSPSPTKLIGCVSMLLEGASKTLAVAAAALLEHEMMSANMLLGAMSSSAGSSGIALHFGSGE